MIDGPGMAQGDRIMLHHERPYGKATEDDLEQHRLRINYELRRNEDSDVVRGKITDNFGRGITAFGERYVSPGQAVYCYDRNRCRADTTQVEMERRKPGNRKDG